MKNYTSIQDIRFSETIFDTIIKIGDDTDFVCALLIDSLYHFPDSKYLESFLGTLLKNIHSLSFQKLTGIVKALREWNICYSFSSKSLDILLQFIARRVIGGEKEDAIWINHAFVIISQSFSYVRFQNLVSLACKRHRFIPDCIDSYLFALKANLVYASAHNVCPITTLQNIKETLTQELENGSPNQYLIKKVLELLNMHYEVTDSEKIFDVALITALHEDEFENLKSLFDLKQTIEDETKIYHIGKILTEHNLEIRVIATYQHKTGIVDAAILATEILNKFKPKYLIMTGVCGGHGDHLNFGDVVFASGLFLYQKGKETDDGFQKETDYCAVDPKLLHKVTNYRRELVRLIKDSDRSRDYSDFSIHIKPMACGLSVINKRGYFDENIFTIDRNTIAVDMESFSVARACTLSNDNKTKAIVIKSVMDKTTKKDDKAKPFAGYTSAQCALYLIETILFS